MKTIVVGPFQCNCRVIVCRRSHRAAIVDPGDEPQKILKALDEISKNLGAAVCVDQLLHTHAHLDHIGATRAVRQVLQKAQGTNVPEIWLHPKDEELYQNLTTQGRLYGLNYETPLPVDRFFEDEQTLRVGELRLQVLHTPGHSPGSVAIRLHQDTAQGIEESVLTGDTLFAGSVGRTDLWGGDSDLMFESIRNRLLVLGDDTVVCPGHGPDSTVGRERRSNPFLT